MTIRSIITKAGAVAVDGSTITGDGTTAAPLAAAGSAQSNTFLGVRTEELILTAGTVTVLEVPLREILFGESAFFTATIQVGWTTPAADEEFSLSAKLNLDWLGDAVAGGALILTPVAGETIGAGNASLTISGYLAGPGAVGVLSLDVTTGIGASTYTVFPYVTVTIIIFPTTNVTVTP